MLDICLLGTGGMVPLPERPLTALMAKYMGDAVLVDCGEGTQTAIRAARLGFKQISVICLTHFHADHMAGLPGLLLTIGNSGRTEPITIIGPKHVHEVVSCLLVIAQRLPFDLEFIETTPGKPLFSLGDMTIFAHAVEHWVPCYAYGFEIRRQGKFNAEKAKALGVPVKKWSFLQAGNPIQADEKIILPSDVMGPERKGLKLCYTTDLRPSDALADFAAGADLFVCEGMYGDPELLENALEHKHCLFTEAAGMAARAGVKELWLTHFSPSMPNPGDYLHFARGIFPKSHIDKRNTTLRFED